MNQSNQMNPAAPPTQMVSGANQLAHFNIRCPACNKLYRVDSREIHSAVPYFDCSACKVRFCFDYPPTNVNKIETRVVSMKDTFQIEDGLDQAELPELRKCPKCEAMNPRLTKECIKCGIIFDKVESVTPEEARLGAIPSLVKAWQDLMSDYDNIKKHMAFVDRCEELQALPYALKKYQTLKEVQPRDVSQNSGLGPSRDLSLKELNSKNPNTNDLNAKDQTSIADQMLKSVLIKNLRQKAESNSFLNQSLKTAESSRILVQDYLRNNVNWPRIQKLAPLVIAGILILVGLSSPSARNMIGFGTAVIFLTLGFRVFLKGRLSLEDFW